LAEPFEKLFGDTSELRVIESLLPKKNRDFNITEMAEESDISRQATIPVVKKFLQWNLLKIDSKHGNANYYKINEDSDFIKAFREINNSIITHILGEELPSQTVQPLPSCNVPKTVPLGMTFQSFTTGVGSDSQEDSWIRVDSVELSWMTTYKTPRGPKANISQGGVYAANAG
jgi:hypothetical protein